LDVELARNIVGSVSSDRIVIVCKDAEKDVILSLLNQIGWSSKIQSIITEDNLIDWYDKALRGQFSSLIGKELIHALQTEISKEFPSLSSLPESLKVRNYSLLYDPLWT